MLVNGHMVIMWFGEWIYGGTVCVGEWKYGGNVVLVNGYMEVLCVGEWTYGLNVVLVNEYMEVLCVLLNGHVEVLYV